MDEFVQKIKIFSVLVGLAASPFVSAAEALFAGFSFTGQWNQRSDLYPHAAALSEERNEQGLSILDSALMDAMSSFQSPELVLNYSQQRDAMSGIPVTLSLGLGGESVEEVRMKNDTVVIYRVMTRILAFDWAEKKLIAAFPLQVVYQEVRQASPSEEEKREVFRKMYADLSFDGNVFVAWREKLERTQIKSTYGLYFGLDSVQLGDAASKILMDQGVNADAYLTQVAQTVESTLSSAQGIGIVPYTAGESIGSNMALRFSDATTLNLELPDPDFKMDLTVQNFRNVEKINGRVRNIYVAAYVDAKVSLSDEGFSKTYFSGDMKHINRLVFSTSDRVVVDFWSAYQTALRALFVRFSEQISQRDAEVIKALNPQVELAPAFLKLNDVMEKCK